MILKHPFRAECQSHILSFPLFFSGAITASSTSSDGLEDTLLDSVIGVFLFSFNFFFKAATRSSLDEEEDDEAAAGVFLLVRAMNGELEAVRYQEKWVLTQ